MPRRRTGEGDLVVESHKLKDWKGALPLGTIKLIEKYPAYYKQKYGEEVSEGDVVASIVNQTLGQNDDFLKFIETSAAPSAGAHSNANTNGGGGATRAASGAGAATTGATAGPRGAAPPAAK